MISVCLYLKIHHPIQLRTDYDFFKINCEHQYEDLAKTERMVRKLASDCYLPMIKQLQEMLTYHQGKFKFSFSITGIALENLQNYAPEVIQGLKSLVNSGLVDVVCEPYYHSLASIYSPKEFIEQIKKHREAMINIFGIKPIAICNTEMIFFNEIAPILETLGFKAVFTQGTRKILGWRSPGYIYLPKTASKISMILNYAPLTEHIQYYFSAKNWREYPITAEKFTHWIHAQSGNGEVVGIFLDMETFGINHHRDSGVFQFLEALPKMILSKKEFVFNNSKEIIKNYQPMARIDVSHPISWGDKERDLSLWQGNNMQNATAEYLYSLEKIIKKAKSEELLNDWRRLTCSDIFYQLHTKWDSENLPHKHFNHQSFFTCAERAYISISNMVNDLELRARE